MYWDKLLCVRHLWLKPWMYNLLNQDGPTAALPVLYLWLLGAGSWPEQQQGAWEGPGPSDPYLRDYKQRPNSFDSI